MRATAEEEAAMKTTMKSPFEDRAIVLIYQKLSSLFDLNRIR